MRRSLSLVLCALALAACGQASCGGCAALAPIPDGGYAGERLDTAAAGRLTAQGFAFVNQSAPQILQTFAPGGVMAVPLPCTIQSMSVFGQMAIADEGSAGCAAESCGLMDGKCDAKDEPLALPVTLGNLRLAPAGPDLVEAEVTITLATGKIHLSSVSRNHLACALLGGGPVKCGLDYDTARATPTDNTLSAQIRFAVDARWHRLLSFEVPSMVGARACGGLGALPKPRCLDPDDVLISTEGACTLCGAANFDLVKTLILDFVAGELRKRLEGALQDQNCRDCGPDGVCPASSVATSACIGNQDAGFCQDPGTGKCVPAVLGVEGRLAVDSLFPVPAGVTTDLLLAAGGATSASDAGFTLGVRGGAQANARSACVKPLTAPQVVALPLPDFDAQAGRPYDAALSLSGQWLSRVAFHLQQSGALCLEVGAEQVAVLESSLLSSFLPSLSKLTHGENVPLRVVLRPQTAPTVAVGAGTVDPVTNKPVDPLLRVELKELEVDLYAQLDERYVRLFTLRLDVSLPFGLSLANCTEVTPVLGDLSAAVSNVQALNSELLPEDLTALQALVPSLLAFAEPMLATRLVSFAVPPFGGWQLWLREAKGLPGGSVSGFQHVGLYAELKTQGTPCLQMKPRLRALALGPSPRGSRLGVQADGLLSPEYQVRVAGGFWSTWQRAEGGVLEVAHPRLLLDGAHDVEVRVRDARAPGALSEPVALTVRRGLPGP